MNRYDARMKLNDGDSLGWDTLRVVLVVAEADSLREAAGMLGMSQPTVSRRVAAAERALGGRLFDRSPEGLRPTEDLAARLPTLRRMREEARTVHDALRTTATGFGEPVRVATTASLGAVDVGPRLASLWSSESALRIELLLGLELVDLHRDGAEIVLRYSRPGSPEFVGRKVAHPEFGLWASEEYLERTGPPRRPADLVRHERIEAVGALARMPGAAWLARAAASPAAARCDELLGIEGVVRAGGGIAVLPRHVAVRAPGLRRVLGRHASWKTPLWLLTRRELTRTVRIRAVLDGLTESYRRAPLR